MIRTWRDVLPHDLGQRARETVRQQWYLGFTSFGGPPVHFKIFHDKFVQKIRWIDEQMYQELFSVAQALNGPGSTKMLYCINLIRNGTLAAIFTFLLWSLPGALGMFGLAIGVFNISEVLPGPAYALLSGLNAAVVGIIALAGVELAHKAITDKLTRSIVFLTASAGMLYNALWYFPTLMAISGLATFLFDSRWLHRPVLSVARKFRRNRGRHGSVEAGSAPEELVVDEQSRIGGDRTPTPGSAGQTRSEVTDQAQAAPGHDEIRSIPRESRLNITWKTGIAIVGGFFAVFISVMVLRGVLSHPPLLFSLFANMFLAGTIIFGGGPVVIPLLREYVVAEGWVSPRDFLIGLAIVQAFPGPNFNFAVFLGALTAINGGYSSVAGALIAWVGIFSPGLILVHGTMGIWSAVRSVPAVKSILRGVNAGAVGLIFTAVYRIWTVGLLDETVQTGSSLGSDPWWLVVAATSYVGGRWFGVNPALAIVLGAVLGLLRYAVISA